MSQLVQGDLVLRMHKRDGREDIFDAKKIKAAILKAGQAAGEFGAE